MDMDRAQLDWLYRQGKIPAKYYFYIIQDDPQKKYEEQRKLFLERIANAEKGKALSVEELWSKDDTERLRAFVEMTIEKLINRI